MFTLCAELLTFIRHFQTYFCSQSNPHDNSELLAQNRGTMADVNSLCVEAKHMFICTTFTASLPTSTAIFTI